ncbi:uncharacterized protein METZ01_LOCUS215987 [marine metagenome]|uniref:Uncharacterized protein n=1 Tax=marine metagenome TaxID=408172 RepID=A0A382FLN9_9ZZZZ
MVHEESMLTDQDVWILEYYCQHELWQSSICRLDSFYILVIQKMNLRVCASILVNLE